MTEFERQMADRLQAHEFLILALIRPHLHAMSAADAEALCDTLQVQFSSLTMPPDHDGSVPPESVMAAQQDAQSLLARMLDQVRRSHPGAGA